MVQATSLSRSWLVLFGVGGLFVGSGCSPSASGGVQASNGATLRAVYMGPQGCDIRSLAVDGDYAYYGMVCGDVQNTAVERVLIGGTEEGSFKDPSDERERVVLMKADPGPGGLFPEMAWIFVGDDYVYFPHTHESRTAINGNRDRQSQIAVLDKSNLSSVATIAGNLPLLQVGDQVIGMPGLAPLNTDGPLERTRLGDFVGFSPSISDDIYGRTAGVGDGQLAVISFTDRRDCQAQPASCGTITDVSLAVGAEGLRPYNQSNGVQVSTLTGPGRDEIVGTKVGFMRAIMAVFEGHAYAIMTKNGSSYLLDISLSSSMAVVSSSTPIMDAEYGDPLATRSGVFVPVFGEVGRSSILIVRPNQPTTALVENISWPRSVSINRRTGAVCWIQRGALPGDTSVGGSTDAIVCMEDGGG